MEGEIEGNSIDSSFKKILIGYILVSIIITLVLDLIGDFSTITLVTSLVFGIIGGYIWYLIIGKYVLMNGSDLDLRSYMILISIIVIFLISVLASGAVPIESRYVLAVLFGIGFIGLCYYRVRQIGYGLFNGSKSLFCKENLLFMIILGGFIFLILLGIYVFVILGYG